MRFAFSDEQVELRRAVRRAVEAHGGVGHARALIGDVAASALGHDLALWRRLADDLGLAGLIAPEACGGAGLGWVEVVAVMEELGGALACTPWFATVALAGAALRVAADDAQQAALWPAIARGERTATFAACEGVTARTDGAGVRLSGNLRHVVDGHRADLLVIAATDAAGEVALYAVPATTAGVHRERLPTMDQTRCLAAVTLEDVRLDASARLAVTGRAAVDRALALARIALAAEQVGGAQRCLDLSVEYAKVRQQFGRPIGSFQAVQHLCADMFVQVESARSAAYYGGWAADHAPDELAEVSAAAAAYCGDAFFRCAGDAIQVHGGIGFTWEHDAHLFFKRARASRALLGSPTAHRDQIARHLGLGLDGAA